MLPDENLKIIPAQRRGGNQRLNSLCAFFAISNNTKNRKGDKAESAKYQCKGQNGYFIFA